MIVRTRQKNYYLVTFKWKTTTLTLFEPPASPPGPCPPTNIQASRDCAANNAMILWQDQQVLGLHTAIIQDQSSNSLNCTSNTGKSCTIPSVPCGKKYNIFVTYNDGNCLSTSTTIIMDSGKAFFKSTCKNSERWHKTSVYDVYLLVFSAMWSWECEGHCQLWYKPADCHMEHLSSCR